MLADSHEAQDAFQATFLVLVGKARTLWVRDSLGPWLHQVAYRTARCARSEAGRRRRHERRAAENASVRLLGEDRPSCEPELMPILHAEIERLPERFRVPVVLCDLMGRSHEQAARSVGCPVGTVKSRLARGRQRLRERLERRGVSPETALIPTVPGSVPWPLLFESTTKAAVGYAASRSGAFGPATSLARKVLRIMFMAQWLKTATVVLAVGAAVTGAGFVAGGGVRPGVGAGDDQDATKPPPAVSKPAETPTRLAGPGKVGISLIERGTVEPPRGGELWNRVEGSSTIISIVPEGSAVKKGQVVGELDSLALNDRLIPLHSAVMRAEAAYLSAKSEREVAEIAVTEYQEGGFAIEVATIQAEITAREVAIRRAKSRLERVKQARLKFDQAGGNKRAHEVQDILPDLELSDRLEDAEDAVTRETAALETAKARRAILDKYTKVRTTKQLNAGVGRKRSAEVAAQSVWELETVSENKLRRQIENCKLVAPADGRVVYANDPNSTAPSLQIEQGAAIRERQLVMTIVNLSAPMLVNTKVGEAEVHQIKIGSAARVKVDAFPDQLLLGVVTEVAPRPDPPRAIGRTVRKIYPTIVRLNDAFPRLRPGMNAQVEILLDEHNVGDVFRVPYRWLSALSADYSKPKPKSEVQVKPLDGALRWQNVDLGKIGTADVEILHKFNDGDSIISDPGALLSSDARLGVTTKPETPARKKAGRSGTPSSPAIRKLQGLSPEQRGRMRGASAEGRKAVLKEAGFTDEEVKELEAMRRPLDAPETPDPDGK